jgi:hypothetical protein
MNVFTPGVREPAALRSARIPPSRLQHLHAFMPSCLHAFMPSCLHAFNAILHALHGFYKIRAAIPFDLLRRTAKFHLLLL